MAKKLTDEQVIASLTLAHEDCDEPDLDPAVAETLNLDEMDRSTLDALRASTKRKRPPKSTTTKGAPRATFGKTGAAIIPLPVTLDDETREALRTVGARTAKQVGEYLLGFVSATSADGPGAPAHVEKDERPEGCVVVNINRIVTSAVGGIAEAARHHKRVEKMRALVDQFNGVRALDPDTFTDEYIESQIRKGCKLAECTDAQTEAILADLFE